MTHHVFLLLLLCVLLESSRCTEEARANLFTLFEELGIKRPRFVESCEQFSWIDKKLDQSIAFYSSYLVGSKQFDRKHTDAAVTSEQEDYLLDEASLRLYFRWYLDWLSVRRLDLLAIR